MCAQRLHSCILTLYRSLSVSNNTVSDIYQVVENLDPWKSYDFSCYFRALSVAKTGNRYYAEPSIKMTVGPDFDAQNGYGIAQHSFSGATGWFQIKGTYNPTDDMGLHNYFHIVVSGLSAIELEVDACSITPGSVNPRGL